MQARDLGDETRIRELRKLRVDLGPLVLAALEDPRTIEVLLDADGRLWQERLGEPMREIGRMEAWQAEALIRTVVAILRVVVTRENPIIGGGLPDGSRFAGQLPPIVSAPCFATRKWASAAHTLEQCADAGVMTLGEGAVVRQAVRPAGQGLVNDHEIEPLGFFLRFLAGGCRGVGRLLL
jgi:type IV secretion system protein TrbB